MRRLPSRCVVSVLLPAAALLCCRETRRADLVLRDARVFVGDGGVLERGTIAIEGDHISAVEAGDSEIRGALEVDATGWTVLPGLIDTHVHLMAIQAESAETVASHRAETLPGLLEQYLEQGITTVRSTGDPWPEIAEVREQLRTGELVGPRLLISGPVLTAPDGHPANSVCGGGSWAWCREHLARELADAEAGRAAVAELAGGGVDFIKVAYEDRIGAQLDLDVLRAIIEEAARRSVPVDVHADPDNLVLEALQAGVDGLVHPPMGELDIESWIGAVEGRTVSTTLGGFSPFDGPDGAPRLPWGAWNEEAEGDLGRLQASIEALWAADRRLAFGTDLPMFTPEQAFFHEAESLLAAGLEPAAVLRLATGKAAEALGLLAELGTVEAGKKADLVIVASNPSVGLESLRRPLVVLRAGEIVVDRR